MTIGERIKEARLKKGLTQGELATILGYKSRSSINKIEVDGRDIPRSMVVKLAKILGVTPSYLMGWDKEIENIAQFNIKQKNLLIEYLNNAFIDENTRLLVYDLVTELKYLNFEGIRELRKRSNELRRFEEYMSEEALIALENCEIPQDAG